MASGKVWRFAYTISDHANPSRFFHLLRDGDAFIELLPVLLGHGYGYGGTLLNLPPEKQKDAGDAPGDGTAELKQPSLPPKQGKDGSPAVLRDLGPEDLLVLTTRPPLNDEKDESRKAVRRGETSMERKIHRAVGRCFAYCDRGTLRLTKPIADQLPPEYADRAEIGVYQYKRAADRGAVATYKQLRADREGRGHKPKFTPRAVVFLIRTALWVGGPRILIAFGMSGNDGLIWAHLLRTRYHDLLVGPEPLFFMGELVAQVLPPRLFTLAFSESWEVIPLLRTSTVPQYVRRRPGNPTEWGDALRGERRRAQGDS